MSIRVLLNTHNLTAAILNYQCLQTTIQKDLISKREMNYHILKSLCCARTGCFGDAGCSALEGIVLLIDKHNKTLEVCVHSTRKFRTASFSLTISHCVKKLYACVCVLF